MLNGTSKIKGEWSIAIAMSAVLFLSVVGFIYLTVAREPPATESRGFAGGTLEAALFLYILAESDLPAKIRTSVPVRRQMGVWTAWLAYLGMAPAFDPRRMPQSRLALVGGVVILLFSIKALLVPIDTR